MLIKRESRSGANDLITVYRPCTIDEMFGNATNKRVIKNALDKNNVAHTSLFTGPPGCGKTTAARILALGLNCKEGTSSKPCLKCESCTSILNYNNLDVMEINVGKSGTKGDISDIADNLVIAPFYSRYKIVIFDEAHALTPASIKLLLKVIEDGYSHVYFIFCTDQPENIKSSAFHRRAISLNLHFGRLPVEVVMKILLNVCEFEGALYTEEVLRFIADKSEGSPGLAVGMLKQILDDGTWDLDIAKELLVGTTIDEDHPQVIELSRALLKQEWSSSIKLFDRLKKDKTFTVEGTRLAVAGYFTGCLRREKNFGKAVRYAKALETLNIPIYDQGKTAENKFLFYMFKTIESMITGGK